MDSDRLHHAEITTGQHAGIVLAQRLVN